jgi:hypothetical protein
MKMANGDEHAIVFEHVNFRGRHRHIFGQEANFADTEDNELNDQISSFVILSGVWRFYRHADFGDQVPADRNFPPGQYANVADFGIDNDQVSSLRAI